MRAFSIRAPTAAAAKTTTTALIKLVARSRRPHPIESRSAAASFTSSSYSPAAHQKSRTKSFFFSSFLSRDSRVTRVHANVVMPPTKKAIKPDPKQRGLGMFLQRGVNIATQAKGEGTTTPPKKKKVEEEEEGAQKREAKTTTTPKAKAAAKKTTTSTSTTRAMSWRR